MYAYGVIAKGRGMKNGLAMLKREIKFKKSVKKVCVVVVGKR